MFQVRSSEVCLFLDVDGTLLEIAATPAHVRVDPDLIEVLASTRAAVSGALSLISGRTIEDIDRLFQPLQLPVAGLHGLERRDAAGQLHPAPAGTSAFPAVRAELEAFARQHSGVILEDKGGALAVHYRLVPDLQSLAGETASKALRQLGPGFELLRGDRVLEIKPASHNKATAVAAFMREDPFAGRTPVFIGDDQTDLDGFAAVEERGGYAIAVGDRVRAARAFKHPRAVREWLRSLAASRVPD